MGKWDRKLRKRLKKMADMQRRNRATFYREEKQKLRERVAKACEQVGEPDPVKLLHYLNQMRRGYDPKHDGPSELMTLVDDVKALEACEREDSAAVTQEVGQA